MDRAKVRRISDDAIKALAEVGRKHGVSFLYAGGRFSDTSVTLKIEAAEIGAGGQVKSKDAETFKRHAAAFGFDPTDLGRTFKIGRSEYTITGLNPRRHKYPVSANRKDGRAFKFPAERVLSALGSPSKVEGLTPEVKSGFVDLACQLSPENLSCDGELSLTQVRTRRANIMRQWRALEARAGRSVSEHEAWDFDTRI